MAAQFDIHEAALIAVLANPVKGEVCFLCSSSNSTECVWVEISDDITGYGWAAGIAYEDREQMHMPPLSLAKFHKTCQHFNGQQLVSWHGSHLHSCMCQGEYSDDLPW